MREVIERGPLKSVIAIQIGLRKRRSTVFLDELPQFLKITISAGGEHVDHSLSHSLSLRVFLGV
jgi:hypothetical protein